MLSLTHKRRKLNHWSAWRCKHADDQAPNPLSVTMLLQCKTIQLLILLRMDDLKFVFASFVYYFQTVLLWSNFFILFTVIFRRRRFYSFVLSLMRCLVQWPEYVSQNCLSVCCLFIIPYCLSWKALWKVKYRQASNTRCALVGNKIAK